MKKTILLASLVATAAMAAGTKGTVKGFFESEGKFETKTSVNAADNKKLDTVTTKAYKVGKIGVETEVKVKDTGLSFGGTFQAKDLALGNVYRPNYLNNSSVFVKYELPEIKGVNSYVKATVSPKFATVLKKDEIVNKGNAELEADVSYKYNDLTFGVNTKTTLPFSNKKAKEDTSNNNALIIGDAIDYATLVSSTHKVYVKGNYAPLKDIKGEIEVNHKYKESAKDAKDAFKYLSLLADASYDVNKDLTLNGKARFKYQFNGEMNFKDQYLGDKDLIESESGDDIYKAPAQYIHFYSLEGVYKGVKDTELSATAFVGHLHASNTVKDQTINTKETTKKDNIAHYGIITNVKYTGVKNLTLSGKAILSGISIVKKQVVTGDTTVANNKTTITKNHYGLLGFGLGAKYDYKVTDKFTVSPEANADVMVFTTKLGNERINVADLTLTPKVSAEYKPVESLTIKGEVSVPVNFGPTVVSYEKQESDTTKYDNSKAINGFGYKSTSIKTSLNVEYKW